MAECYNSPVSSSKKIANKNKLIKTKTRTTKTKKNLFKELTFVEEHVETFYVGLRENMYSAYNPIQAKIIDKNEAQNVVKDWVQPDKELTKVFHDSSTKKKSKLNNMNRKSATNSRRPLKFIETNQVENCFDAKLDESSTFEIRERDSLTESVSIVEEFESNGDSEKQVAHLNGLFDDLNLTQHRTLSETTLSPSKYKVYVNDTPVDYYGLSMLEKRRRGFKF
jgi:hypothetical protein